MARTVGKLKGLWFGILDNSSLAPFYNKLKLNGKEQSGS